MTTPTHQPYKDFKKLEHGSHDLQEPTNFYTSMTEAEVNCYNMLLHTTNFKSGKGAYIARLGNNIEAWRFNLTVPFDTSAPYWTQHDKRAISYLGEMELRFTKRQTIQELIMKILHDLPLDCVGNVYEFKVEAIGPITDEIIQLSNEHKPIVCYNCVIQFYLAFNTGGVDTVVK